MGISNDILNIAGSRVKNKAGEVAGDMAIKGVFGVGKLFGDILKGKKTIHPKHAGPMYQWHHRR